ncbi:MAG: cellulase family glycosylhydrolase [bacterium]|nr:cellulase family glycosylhydrolase [bacterium]
MNCTKTCLSIIVVLVSFFCLSNFSYCIGNQGFVKVNDTYLWLGDTVFFYNGSNAPDPKVRYEWHIGTISGTSTRPWTNQACIDDFFDEATALNLKVVRFFTSSEKTAATWFPGYSSITGSTTIGGYRYVLINTTYFTNYIDPIVYSADSHGIRLLTEFTRITHPWEVPAIPEQLPGKGGPVRWVNYCTGSSIPIGTESQVTTAYRNYCDLFYSNLTCKQEFKKYIDFMLNRYKNNPTFLGWHLLHEGRGYTDTSANLFYSWVTEMSAYVRQIDPNHIITIGDGGAIRDGNYPYFTYIYGLDWEKNIKYAKAVDVGTYESYDTICEETTLSGAYSLLSTRYTYCHNSAFKPMLIEEFDYSNNDWEQASSYRCWYNIVSTYRGCGTNFWQHGHIWTSLTYGTISIIPAGIIYGRDTYTCATVKSFSNYMNSITGKGRKVLVDYCNDSSLLFSYSTATIIIASDSSQNFKWDTRRFSRSTIVTPTRITYYCPKVRNFFVDTYFSPADNTHTDFAFLVSTTGAENTFSRVTPVVLIVQPDTSLSLSAWTVRRYSMLENQIPFGYNYFRIRWDDMDMANSPQVGKVCLHSGYTTSIDPLDNFSKVFAYNTANLTIATTLASYFGGDTGRCARISANTTEWIKYSLDTDILGFNVIAWYSYMTTTTGQPLPDLSFYLSRDNSTWIQVYPGIRFIPGTWNYLCYHLLYPPPGYRYLKIEIPPGDNHGSYDYWTPQIGWVGIDYYPP